MSKKLYVGNLSFEATEAELSEAFGKHGTVTRASIATDRESGRSRGFGFVEMSDGADAAIAALNGTMLSGRTVVVNEAKPREAGSRSGSDRGGRGGSGGSGPRRY